MSDIDGSRVEALHVVDTAAVAPRSWRNGGGTTRELLAWPRADEWVVRVSLAQIEADGPFSAFPGVTRWFAVVEGDGVILRWGGEEWRLVPGDAPIAFEGEAPPDCALVAGPTRDVNFMHRGGHGAMRAVERGVAWSEPCAWRALFAATAGTLRADGRERAVHARSLAWQEGGGSAWSFDADGWWLEWSVERAGRPIVPTFRWSR